MRPTRSRARSAKVRAVLQNGRPRVSGWEHAVPAASGGPSAGGVKSHVKLNSAMNSFAPQDPLPPPGHGIEQLADGAGTARASAANPQ